MELGEILYRGGITTPAGDMIALASQSHLLALVFKNHPKLDQLLVPFSIADAIDTENDVIHQTRQQLDAYFAGELKEFDLPIVLNGTDFQKDVWQGLVKVGHGATCSYHDLACAIGREKSVRAVANALGQNRHLIIIPCHRVLRKDGSLGGYSGGTGIKQILMVAELAIK